MPKPYNPKRRTRFIDKPRGWRRDRFVAQRWKIRQDPNGRGVYTSHYLMNGGVYDGQVHDEPGESHTNSFRFVSKARARDGIIYSATVRTALMVALDFADEYAWKKEEEILTDEEYALAHPPLEFIPVGNGYHEPKHNPDPVFDRLGGQTVWAIRAKALREAIDHLPPITPQVVFDDNYSTGIGAHFITTDTKITIDSLAALVEEFWARGEVAYEDAPVDFSENHPENHAALRALIENQAQSFEHLDRLARGEREDS